MDALAPLRMPRADSDLCPIIVVDTREQTPLSFGRLASVVGTLTTGDYSFVGGQELFAVERKTIQDLVSCCTGENRERFARELHRLRGFRFKRLLVIGSLEAIQAGHYPSKISPRSVLNTLSAFEMRFDVPVVFSPTPALAALTIETWVWWFFREMVKNLSGVCRAQDQGLPTNGRHVLGAGTQAVE